MSFKKLSISIFIFFVYTSAANAADVYFNDVYTVTSPSSSYDKNSGPSFTLGSKISGRNFKFTNNSSNSFTASGNDVAGTFSYYNNSGVLVSINGTISRQDKSSGNITQSVYFWRLDGTLAYFFVIPGKEALYSNGSSISNTASNSMGAALDGVVNVTPQIIVSATSLSPFVSCVGSASDYQTFNVSATKLQANLTIVPPNGFEVSLNSTLSYTTSTLTITPVSNTVTTTTIYVRLASSNPTGAYSNQFIISSSTNSNIANTTVSGTVYAIPTISISETDVSAATNNDNIICANGSATLTAIGGTSYLWSSGATTTSITISTATNTTYTVTGTTSGCSNTASITITVLPIPNMSIGSIDPITITSTIFYIPYTDNGGGGSPNQYSITTGTLAMPSFSNVTLTSTTASPISVIVPESAANPYNFIISFKNVSACLTNYDLTLNVVDPSVASNSITLSPTSNNSQSLCASNAIANILYATTGATGTNITGLPLGVTGNWTSNQLTISGTPTQSGVYNYTINLTGGSGNGSATGTITVNSLPNIGISGNTTDVELVTLTASGGNTYAWSDGSSISSTTNTFDASGLYSLTVTGANGCISSTQLNISVKNWGLSKYGEKILDSTTQINSNGEIGTMYPLSQEGKKKEYKVRIIRDGLVLNLDAGNASSYPGTGTTWYDLSGNNNDIVFSSTPNYNSSNGGFFQSFNGSNTVSSTLATTFNHSSFTIEWWINPSSVTNFNNQISLNGAVWNDFVSHMGTGNKMYIGSTTGERFEPDNLAVEGAWQSYTYTFENGASFATAKFYKNGVLLNSATNWSNNNNIIRSIQLGVGGANSINGSLGPIKIYNNALNPNQIQRNYNSLKSRFGL